MAYHDSLTGLPNRHMFNETLAKILEQSQHDKKVAVMFLDLDRFKFINDTMGHEAGDELLKLVSKRLVKCVNEGSMISRQGGDEFTILLEDKDQISVKDIAERMIEAFSPPFMLKEEEFFITPSIGISLYPNDGQDIKTLTKNADKAMYLAKKWGKNN
jgi:diguanylate cyclase (GGDEF)-like protein